LMPGTPEYEAFITEIRRHILENRALVEPIFVSGDVVMMSVGGPNVTIEGWNEERCQRMAQVLEQEFPGDTVSPAWFRRRSEVGRVFLIMGTGTLLFNFEPSGKLSLEPGSNDYDSEQP